VAVVQQPQHAAAPMADQARLPPWKLPAVQQKYTRPWSLIPAFKLSAAVY
jgi:hypothetical protein